MDVFQRCARDNGGEPDAGRRLLSWALAAGFTDVTPTASVWCFATPADREWWGGMWAERILNSALTTQALDSGYATEADLQEISDAWRTWAPPPMVGSPCCTARSSPGPEARARVPSCGARGCGWRSPRRRREAPQQKPNDPARAFCEHGSAELGGGSGI